MKMFDALNGMVTIIKSLITTISSDNVHNYEPADGMPDTTFLPGVFCYMSDTDFTEADGSSSGEQNHKPNYYIDIYVKAESVYNSGTQTYTYSIDEAHITMREIIDDIYNIIMAKDFRLNLEDIIGQTGGTYPKRIEKLGVSKIAESNTAFLAMRITMMIDIEEDPPGATGVTLSTFEDSITAKTKEQIDNE